MVRIQIYDQIINGQDYTSDPLQIQEAGKCFLTIDSNAPKTTPTTSQQKACRNKYSPYGINAVIMDISSEIQLQMQHPIKITHSTPYCLPWKTKSAKGKTTERNPKSPQIKKLGHIVRAKRALQSVTKCLTKQKRSQREKKLHPCFSWGAVVIIQSVGVWNPADKLLLSVDLNGQPERPREPGHKLSFVRALGSFCLDLDSCSSTSCSPRHPPLHHHMLIQLVNMTVNAVTDSWSKSRLLLHEATVSYDCAIDTFPCRLLGPCLCVNCRLIWQSPLAQNPLPNSSSRK